LLQCISPVLAQSGGGQRVEFTSAFGGAAEVHGWRASTAFDANEKGASSLPGRAKYLARAYGHDNWPVD
jgi:hypothetical protein